MRYVRSILAVTALSFAVALGSLAGAARAADDNKPPEHVTICTLTWDSDLHKWKLDCRIILVPKQ